MTDIRRADPIARRRAVRVIIVAAAVGILLIAAFERYRIPLREWIIGEPGEAAQRIQLMFLVLAALLLVPLLAFAAYLWSLGASVIRAREFPPPGHRVVRNTQVITGEAAIARARQLKVFALVCGIACAILAFLLWHLAALFGNSLA
jgi:hypothetical protein